MAGLLERDWRPSMSAVTLFKNAGPPAAADDNRADHISVRGEKPYALGVVRC